jgi:hypothetical protein
MPEVPLGLIAVARQPRTYQASTLSGYESALNSG